MILDVWSLERVTFLSSSTEPPIALSDTVDAVMRRFEKRMKLFLALDNLETYVMRNDELKYQPDFSLWSTSPAEATQAYQHVLQLSHETATLDDLTEDERHASEAISQIRYRGMDTTEADRTYRLLKERCFQILRQEIDALIAALQKIGFEHQLTNYQYATPSVDSKHDWVRILLEFADPI